MTEPGRTSSTNSGSLPASQFTGLILLSGVDTPGITQALFTALAPFSITIIDIEQVVARDRVILTVLISLNPDHREAIEEDLNACALELGVDIATSFQVQEISSIAAKTGLMHVVALGNPLAPSAIASIAAEIAEHGGNIERIHRTASYPITAIEFVISEVDQQCIREGLAQIANSEGVDIAVSPGGLMRWAKKLVVMDVDSTLIQQEVIDLLGTHAGVETQIREITERAMRGEIDFEASLRARVALLEGLDESVISQVRNQIVLTPGARTLVTTLQKLGHSVAVVSGGFTAVIEPLIKELNISHYRANSLEIIGGKLTGKITGKIIDRAAKAEALRDFAKAEGVELEQTIAIGDGANDLDMIAAAGLGIAFNAKPAVKAAADSTVSAPYLDSVLYLLGITREEVEEASFKAGKRE
ncbi:MAG: phosphoserine phosphatase SerB [Actinobacteria bacterium]|uniref:phosphoserine phosphatase n=1 Tax=freshwater metagenome TaxID=449393 RepID=A0A6J6B9K1_9ZZZZ|nr:phosphoserine phosphatase SerB [Actinomycetota bacterium]MTA20775.1 phosphoserine phosphatase SerB [Actinomycetota bacterium]